MNADRRKRLEAIITTLESAAEDLEGVKGEEADAFEALPEGLQQAERGQQMSEAVDNLESRYDELQSLIDGIRETVEA